MENLRWIAAAALSAYACQLAVLQTTPIDRALPLLAVAATFLAWLSYPALMLAVPLLLVSEIAIVDETRRLLAFGVVLAACVAISLFEPRDAASGARRSAGASVRRFTLQATAPIVTIVAIVLLRWIPLANVLLFREALILVIAAATVAVLGNTPFAVFVATATALVTPAIPMRTMLVPILVLFAASLARLFGMPPLRLMWPSAMAIGFAMLFFAWSGIVARAFPYFLREVREPGTRTIVANALAANVSMTYDVPPDTKSVIVSGANVAHLRRGALLGRIEPGGIVVRIGDAADWGYMRREHFYRAHNPLPRDVAGIIRDYGYAAWIDGAGRVPLPRGARRIRVTADASLPPGASLQVEGFE